MEATANSGLPIQRPVGRNPKGKIWNTATGDWDLIKPAPAAASDASGEGLSGMEEDEPAPAEGETTPSTDLANQFDDTDVFGSGSTPPRAEQPAQEEPAQEEAAQEEAAQEAAAEKSAAEKAATHVRGADPLLLRRAEDAGRG